MTAPAFQDIGGIASDADPHTNLAVTPPVHAVGDILVLMVMVRAQTDTVTVSGWTQMTGSPFDRGASSRYWVWWKRAASTGETCTVTFSGTAGDAYAIILSYRGATTSGDPWEVKGTPATGTTDPAVLNGITALSAESLIIALLAGEDNNNASITTTATDPANFVTHYDESGTGADAMFGFSEATQAVTGPTGNVSVKFSSGVPVGWGGMVLALIPTPPAPPAAGGRASLTPVHVTYSR